MIVVALSLVETVTCALFEAVAGEGTCWYRRPSGWRRIRVPDQEVRVGGGTAIPAQRSAVKSAFLRQGLPAQQLLNSQSTQTPA